MSLSVQWQGYMVFWKYNLINICTKKLQTYKLKNLPFFQEARAALKEKCDCPHCTCDCEHCKNKIKQAENAGEYFKKLTKN